MASKKRIYLILVMAVLALTLSGCSDLRKAKDIKVTSCGVKYVAPTSSRSVDAVLLLGIDNPSVAFTVSDVEGQVRRGEKVLGYFTAGEIELEPRTEATYELPCTAVLAEGVSVLEIFAIAMKRSYDDLAADIILRVKLRNGLGKDLEFKDMNIKGLFQPQ
ncbi:MAG: hypothetical protein IJR77_05130 [Bacteroidales bacterium]|nr:hypothetical protein [Bacteroidales bacterium]